MYVMVYFPCLSAAHKKTQAAKRTEKTNKKAKAKQTEEQSGGEAGEMTGDANSESTTTLPGE